MQGLGGTWILLYASQLDSEQTLKRDIYNSLTFSHFRVESFYGMSGWCGKQTDLFICMQ